MWKAPNRPNHEITQSFNSGIVSIYSVENAACTGYRPKEKLIEKYSSVRFEEQRLGINRLYLSRQNQTEIELVIRVPRLCSVSVQDIAVINKGKQYAVDSIQAVLDVWPSCIDLALTKIEQNYEVPNDLV